jgi:hypothetical protein
LPTDRCGVATHRQGDPFPPSVGLIIFNEKEEKEYITNEQQSLDKGD